mmetsp:Transcript_120308/g.384071  ORF Transcript_120308/g.384071 Transcript_120308/m.384071 type:complete len:231 (-) Transcript_120308:296-988(-)
MPRTSQSCPSEPGGLGWASPPPPPCCWASAGSCSLDGARTGPAGCGSLVKRKFLRCGPYDLEAAGWLLGRDPVVCVRRVDVLGQQIPNLTMLIPRSCKAPSRNSYEIGSDNLSADDWFARACAAAMDDMADNGTCCSAWSLGCWDPRAHINSLGILSESTLRTSPRLPLLTMMSLLLSTASDSESASSISDATSGVTNICAPFAHAGLPVQPPGKFISSQMLRKACQSSL